MNQVHLGVRVPEPIDEALEQVAHEARTSKSEIVRRYITDALEDEDDAIPDHLQTEVKRERLKRQNRLTHQRIYFRSNVAERFEKAFKQGDLDGEMGDSAIEDLRDIYVEDAQVLFEDDDRRENAVAFVEAVAEHAKDATDASEFDRLDPEEIFERYSGVEAGVARREMDRLVDIADDILDQRLPDGQYILPSTAVDRLVEREDVPEDVAEEAVDRAQDRRDGNGGGGGA